MIFDTHCHLGHDAVAPAAVRARAAAAGVSLVLDVGIDLASSRAASARSRSLPGTHWSAGLHPNDAQRFAAEWPQLAELCAEPGCVAVGETGLDFYRDWCPPAEQEQALVAHLELARRLGKPVILHCRDAFAPLFAVLRREGAPAGVMHCFSGDVAAARQALDLGLYLSFAGPLTYPKSEALRAAAAFAPADRILVETDAPFLPPQGWRGQRNEPAYVTATVAKLAEVRSLTPDAAAAITCANGCRLFRVG